MKPIAIPAAETGVIRVFAVNRAVPEIAKAIRLQGKAEAASELLGQSLPGRGIELFPTSDLDGVGLPAYLADGYALDPAEIARDHGRLDGLDGYVLLLFSSAFDGASAQITPRAGLTLIGTYREAQPDNTAAPIDSAAAQPYSGTPRLTPALPPRGRAGAAITGLALLTIALLVLWWAFS
ncbi:MAG: hypothetical protein ACSHWZ_02225 [Sulfitobacter sp.]